MFRAPEEKEVPRCALCVTVKSVFPASDRVCTCMDMSSTRLQQTTITMNALQSPRWFVITKFDSILYIP